jgi:hypothetical protein
MDLVTTAIVGAVSKLGETIIKDAYEALKTAIVRKFGKDSSLAEAVERLEKKPNSDGRREALKKEVAVAKADQDPEILKAVQDLLDRLEDQRKPSASKYVTEIHGNVHSFVQGPNARVIVSGTPKQEE